MSSSSSMKPMRQGSGIEMGLCLVGVATGLLLSCKSFMVTLLVLLLLQESLLLMLLLQDSVLLLLLLLKLAEEERVALLFFMRIDLAGL